MGRLASKTVFPSEGSSAIVQFGETCTTSASKAFDEKCKGPRLPERGPLCLHRATDAVWLCVKNDNESYETAQLFCVCLLLYRSHGESGHKYSV